MLWRVTWIVSINGLSLLNQSRALVIIRLQTINRRPEARRRQEIRLLSRTLGAVTPCCASNELSHVAGFLLFFAHSRRESGSKTPSAWRRAMCGSRRAYTIARKKMYVFFFFFENISKNSPCKKTSEFFPELQNTLHLRDITEHKNEKQKTNV